MTDYVELRSESLSRLSHTVAQLGVSMREAADACKRVYDAFPKIDISTPCPKCGARMYLTGCGFCGYLPR